MYFQSAQLLILDLAWGRLTWSAAAALWAAAQGSAHQHHDQQQQQQQQQHLVGACIHLHPKTKKKHAMMKK